MKNQTQKILAGVVGAIPLAVLACQGPGDAAIADGKVPQQIDCFEDEIVAWDGDDHTICVTLDDFAGHDDWSARLGEIVAEELEAR